MSIYFIQVTRDDKHNPGERLTEVLATHGYYSDKERAEETARWHNRQLIEQYLSYVRWRHVGFAEKMAQYTLKLEGLISAAEAGDHEFPASPPTLTIPDFKTWSGDYQFYSVTDAIKEV